MMHTVYDLNDPLDEAEFRRLAGMDRPRTGREKPLVECIPQPISAPPRARRKPETLSKPLERDILSACLKLLSTRGIPCFRNNTGAFALGDGPSKRFFRAGTVGSSDILGVIPPSGRFLAIETKRPGEKPTAEQRAFLRAVQDAGGVGLVITDVRELAEALDGLA
jgi:hypothetical protein